MSERLKNRLAVITGGADGLGRVLAKRLAAEGANIAVADINPADETRNLVEAAGQRFFSAICDMSDEAQVNAFADQVRASLGPIDILINNAAISKVVSFEDTSFELFKQMFSINVFGYFLAAKAFLPDLKQSKAGRVINLSSASYFQGPPSFLAYVSTKGAINGFTHTLATELGPHNVTVNAIAPHVMRTPTTRRELTDEIFKAQTAYLDIKREQTPEDVAGMAAFLASDDAAFITGKIHVVDGGLVRR